MSEDQFEKYITEDTVAFVINSLSSNVEQPQQPRRGFETAEMCLSMLLPRPPPAIHMRIHNCHILVIANHFGSWSVI